MKRRPSLPVILALVALSLAPSLAEAGDTGRRWWSPKLRSKQTADDAQTEKTEQQKPAGESEPSAEKAQPQPAPVGTTHAPATAAAATAVPQQEPPAPAAAPESASPAPAAAATAAAATAAAQQTPPAPPPPPVPDASLQKIIVNLRKTPIGSEPTAVAYLDLIAAGRAKPEQVNDFAAYLSKRGMPKIAMAFQEYAVHLNPENAILWMNLGTIRVAANSLGSAETAFKKSIAIDPTRALAHYNLGSVYDAQKNYDTAIEEYRRALVLDPELADPRKNPQVVNNENLLAVKLQIYQAQAGSLGLPLLQMQKPPAAVAPPPQKH